MKHIAHPKKELYNNQEICSFVQVVHCGWVGRKDSIVIPLKHIRAKIELECADLEPFEHPQKSGKWTPAQNRHAHAHAHAG